MARTSNPVDVSQDTMTFLMKAFLSLSRIKASSLSDEKQCELAELSKLISDATLAAANFGTSLEV